MFACKRFARKLKQIINIYIGDYDMYTKKEKTVYMYNDKELMVDEEGVHTIESVQAHYADYYPELANSTYTVTPATEKGDKPKPKTVVFAKKVGTKGCAMDDLLNGLEKMNPHSTDGFVLLKKLSEGEFDTAGLMAHSQAIESAASELEQLAYNSEMVIKRCMLMKPSVASKVPMGF